MRRVIQPCLALIILAAAVIAVGCSDPYSGRMEVTGKVNLVGEPIDGIIDFKPLEKQNADTHSGAPIKKGEYIVPRKNGLMPGKYMVQITSGTGTPANLEEGAGPGPGGGNFTSQDKVPEDWNLKSTHEIEVKAGVPNNFDFDIDHYNPKYKPRKK
jgi:hypothetical protein